MASSTTTNNSKATDYSCLFQEIVAMWGSSVTAPAATNLRILAKEGKLSEEDTTQVLTLPLQAKIGIQLFLKYKDLLLKEFSNDIGIPFHVQVMEHLEDYVPIDETQEIVIFDDANRDSELVYGIGLCRKRKRITLTFRGSVSEKDYIVDFTAIMKSVSNPVKGQSKLIKVHTGYKDYLDGKLENNGGKSKFDIIVEHLKTLLDENPDFGIYITGHSLGGSLAYLTAFQLASIPEIPSPITVVAFGGLLVGDVRFRRAFQSFEKSKRIRCLNVMNKGDIIPLLPPQGYLTPYVCIGTKIMLSDDNGATITRDPNARTLFGAYMKNIPSHVLHWCRLFYIMCFVKDFGDNHSVLAYSKNMTSESVESTLKKLTVNDVCTPESALVRTAM